MSTSINDLPVEILVDIMRRIHDFDLKKVKLTCKKWKDVIDEHCLRKMLLTTDISAYDSPPSTFIQAAKRNIHTIELRELTNHHDYIIDICKHVGGRVSQLIWDQGKCPSDVDSLIPNLLKCSPNLEHIEFRDACSEGVPEHCEVPELKKLKTLEISNCNAEIFTFFRTTNLESLILSDSKFLQKSSKPHVENFVRRQTNLMKLKLDDFATFLMESCSTDSNETQPLELSHLIVDDMDGYDDYVALVNFTKTQSTTLTKLEIFTKFSNSICELIFGDLKGLKYLSFYMNDEVELYMSETENRSIESLQIIQCNVSPQALEAFCSRMPNVRYLSLRNECNAERLRIISATLPNLVALCVERFNESLVGIRFPNLTSFQIGYFGECFDWDEFIETNSSVTEIIVGNVRFCGKNLHNVETFTRNLILERSENVQPSIREYPQEDWFTPESSELIQELWH